MSTMSFLFLLNSIVLGGWLGIKIFGSYATIKS